MKIIFTGVATHERIKEVAETHKERVLGSITSVSAFCNDQSGNINHFLLTCNCCKSETDAVTPIDHITVKEPVYYLSPNYMNVCLSCYSFITAYWRNKLKTPQA